MVDKEPPAIGEIDLRARAECAKCPPDGHRPEFFYQIRISSTGERTPVQAANLFLQMQKILNIDPEFIRHNVEKHGGRAVLTNFEFQFIGPKIVRSIKLKK